MNNADFGLTLQSLICDYYGLEVNEHAAEQFTSSYNEEYEKAIYFFALNADENKDINSIGNAALSYDKLGDAENAVIWYEKAIEAGHRDAENYKKRVSELQ